MSQCKITSSSAFEMGLIDDSHYNKVEDTV